MCAGEEDWSASLARGSCVGTPAWVCSHYVHSADEDAYEYDDELGRPSAEEEVQRLEKRPVEAATAAQPAARVAKPQQRCRSSDLSRNGAAVGDAYVWSQTATEVTLSVRVPPGTRARDVTVSLSRHAADKNHSVRVTVNGQTALDNELAFPIDVPHSSNPDDGGSAAALPGVAPDTAAAEDVDWALDDFDAEASDAPRRVVRVTMRKAGIRGASETGVVLWWNKCFRDHPEERNIDTSALADRHAASQRTQQARKAWQEAEAMFLARVKQGPQHTIIED